MFIAPPDMAANPPSPPARSSARQERAAPDHFGALVDSSAPPEQPAAPAPDRAQARRTDDRAATPSNDRSRADQRSVDAASDSRTRDTAQTNIQTEDAPVDAISSPWAASDAGATPNPAVASEIATKPADVATEPTSKTGEAIDPTALAAPPLSVVAVPVAATATVAPTPPAPTTGTAPAAVAPVVMTATQATSTPSAGTAEAGAAEGQPGVTPDVSPELAAAALVSGKPAKETTKPAAPDSNASLSGPAASSASGQTETSAPQPVAAIANSPAGAAVDPKAGPGSDGAPAADSASAPASPTASPAQRDVAAQVTVAAAGADQMMSPPLQPHQHIAAPAPAPHISVAVATGAPVPTQAVAMEIAAMAQGGASRFEIRLDPAELGRIDVRIDIDKHGRVTSHLTVEKPETLAMLRQDAPQLQRALDDAGLKSGDGGGLQFSLRDQSGHNNGEQQRPQHAQRLVLGDQEIVPAPIVGRSYGRMLGTASGVDIRV